MEFIKKILLLFLTAGFLSQFGCSASTNSSRYKNNTPKKKSSNENIRYQNKEDSKLNSTNITILDTSNFSDDEEEFEGYYGEEPKIDLSDLLKKYSTNSSPIESDKANILEKFLMEIIKYLDTPYKYGGNSSRGIDCSAFTQNVFNNAFDIMLNRSAREQFQQGEEINSKEELQFGDLIFFDTRRRVKPGHVGIFLGDNLFVHASRKFGVTVSSLEQDYYSKRFMGGRRIEEIFDMGY